MSTLVLQDELLKAFLNIIVSGITLGFTWLVGQQLTNYWAIQQKRKELELSAVHDFYKLYGEFFAIWKLWSYCIKQSNSHTLDEETRWKLLERASAAEGALEAIFVKLSSEREMSKSDNETKGKWKWFRQGHRAWKSAIKLSQSDIETLGEFRQAYQTLRQAIKNNVVLDWEGSDDPKYLLFKQLASRTACIIVPDNSINRQNETLIEITGNRWQARWENKHLKNQGTRIKT